MKYKIEKFEKTIKKSYKDVKKYDVARFDYGDEGNTALGIILEIKQLKPRLIEFTFADITGKEEVAYDYTYGNDSIFEIVGRAKELDKKEDLQR